MMLLKMSLMASSLLLLISCSSLIPEPQIITETVTIRPSIAIVPKPRPVDLSDMEWRVVTHENVDEFIQSIGIGSSGEYVFYAISVRDYEKIALNINELKRYILQQQEIIAYYERAVSVPEEIEEEVVSK